MGIGYALSDFGIFAVMNILRLKYFTGAFAMMIAFQIQAQDSIPADVLNSFSFRSIGPATTGGRIADIAVNPANHSE